MKIKFTQLTFVALLISLVAQGKMYAADGGQLFKSRCNTCHMVDKNSTGPKLQGAKQKWVDAGEGDLIYDWITNSSALIASGKSARAKEVSGFSPTAMPPQTVSKEEIDAILTFVDAPPVVTTAPSDTTATATVGTETKPDYVANLSMFNWMIFLMVILILIIIVLAGAIMTYVKSDYFRTKVAEMGDKSKLLIIVITTGSLFISNESHALNFMQAGEAEKGMPWLQVENTDLYALLVVNIILLIVVLYLRHLFYQMVAMVRPKKEEVQQVPVVAETFKKVNAILTDAVPIEEEHTILMDHEYDGIRELDNNLPPWWVWGFFATIVFAFIYIINYHVLGTSDLQEKAYKKEMAKAEREIAAYREKMAMNVDETNATLMTGSADLAAGKVAFGVNCVTCHKADGSGDVGPNLTDKNWIYGYDIKDVFATIKLGRPNGMPTHDALLNPIQIQQVASYVLSLKEVANGKPTQGDIIKK